jgi:hypothetical protein
MKRRHFSSLLGGTALTPLTALSVFADPPDSAALCRMADRLAATSDANIHGVLVAHGGKLVFERYFTGSDEIYGRPVGKITFNAALRRWQLADAGRPVAVARPLQPLCRKAVSQRLTASGQGMPPTSARSTRVSTGRYDLGSSLGLTSHPKLSTAVIFE